MYTGYLSIYLSKYICINRNIDINIRMVYVGEHRVLGVEFRDLKPTMPS